MHDEPTVAAPQLQLPKTGFPLANDLPVMLTRAFQEYTNDAQERCAVMGATSPILAVFLGASQAMLGEQARRSRNAGRREVVKLLQAFERQVGTKTEPGTKPLQKNIIELTLLWCSSPVVPTYELGVKMIINGMDEKSRKDEVLQAKYYVWILRLVCFRSDVVLADNAPTLASVCQAIMNDSCEELTKCLESVSRMGNKSVTWSETVGKK